MLMGVELFPAKNYVQLFDFWCRVDELLDDKRNNIPPDAFDLLKKILKLNPKDRISIKDIFQHPYVEKKCKNGFECDEIIDKEMRSIPSYSDTIMECLNFLNDLEQKENQIHKRLFGIEKDTKKEDLSEDDEKEIKKDLEVVLLRDVKRCGSNLISASDELKNNKEIVIEAVKKNGHALEFASDELRNNKEIVLEAVKKNGLTLEFASDELKNNKKFVLEAVKKNGRALELSSDELKNTKELLFEAVKKNGHADEIKKEEDVEDNLEKIEKEDNFREDKIDKNELLEEDLKWKELDQELEDDFEDELIENKLEQEKTEDVEEKTQEIVDREEKKEVEDEKIEKKDVKDNFVEEKERNEEINNDFVWEKENEDKIEEEDKDEDKIEEVGEKDEKPSDSFEWVDDEKGEELKPKKKKEKEKTKRSDGFEFSGTFGENWEHSKVVEDFSKKDFEEENYFFKNKYKKRSKKQTNFTMEGPIEPLYIFFFCPMDAIGVRKSYSCKELNCGRCNRKLKKIPVHKKFEYEYTCVRCCKCTYGLNPFFPNIGCDFCDGRSYRNLNISSLIKQMLKRRINFEDFKRRLFQLGRICTKE